VQIALQHVCWAVQSAQPASQLPNSCKSCMIGLMLLRTMPCHVRCKAAAPQPIPATTTSTPAPQTPLLRLRGCFQGFEGSANSPKAQHTSPTSSPASKCISCGYQATKIQEWRVHSTVCCGRLQSSTAEGACPTKKETPHYPVPAACVHGGTTRQYRPCLCNAPTHDVAANNTQCRLGGRSPQI
jgi:hypothetical protein